MSEIATLQPAEAGVPLSAKRCTVCRAEKPLFEFHPDPRRKDGLRSACRACRCRREAARRAGSREAIRTQQRAYYARNAAKIGKRSKAWREANPERSRAYMREYMARHPEKRSAYRQRWSSANPDKRRAHSRFWHAFAAGQIEKPDQCSECYASGYVEAHHDNYDRPLDVRWLCEICHAAADKARRGRV